MARRNPRIQVCLSPVDIEHLRSLARASDLSLSAYVRRLCRATGPEGGSGLEVRLTALAALVAAEHSLTLLETMLPDGVRRSAALREDAVRAAEERLDLLRDQLGTGEASDA